MMESRFLTSIPVFICPNDITDEEYRFCKSVYENSFGYISNSKIVKAEIDIKISYFSIPDQENLYYINALCNGIDFPLYPYSISREEIDLTNLTIHLKDAYLVLKMHEDCRVNIKLYTNLQDIIDSIQKKRLNCLKKLELYNNWIGNLSDG